MEVLRSKVAERPERDATIEGIYGSKGFFFQQRRGHLDLRGISNIDLEKVVREVDVDTLQLYIENITFCNLREEDLRYLTDPQVIKMFKMSQLIIEYLLYSQDLFVANLGELSKKYVAKKKSLAKKRRELAELEEATKHLRNQVKAKKQNISTLEDLLRENSRRSAHEPKPHPVEQPRQARPDKISFFVAGPDGLCVEFTERPETSIFNLRKSVSQAFVSKRDTESEHYNKVVRLVHKGILMLDDRTIEYYGIKVGDTVVTVIEKGEPVAPAPAAQQPAPAKDNNNLTEMIEFLSKQQDAMRQFANDIKYGWENALLTLKSNRDGEHNLEDSEKRLLTKIDDKWNLFESGMRLQLEAKLNDYQALLLAQKSKEEHLPNIQVIRRRPHVGELEDDNDAPGLNDITDKLNQFGNQLNRLEVKTVHTDESVEDLRNMLRNRPTAAPTPVIINTTTTTPPAAAPVLGTRPVAKIEIAPPSPKKSADFKVVKNEGNAYNPHYNKWNHLDDGLGLKAASVVQEKDHVQVSLGSFEVPVVEKPPEKVVEPPKVKSPPPAVKAKPAEKKVAARKEPAPKPVEKKPAVRMVDIVFPAVYHTDDMAVFHGEKVLAVQLPENLPAEDVVFLLRKEIANKVQVPLTRVTLVLRGKSITLDVDADEEVLTVESVKSYAANGVLIFKVNKGKPMTNAQIDLLVPSWQRASREDPASVTPTPAEGDKKRPIKKRRDWNDDEDVPDDDPQMLSKNMYKVVRGSLDEALSGVSDREGLTDDELHQKMESLKQFTESLPMPVSEHMRNYKGKVTKSITAASIDSGSEDLLPQVTLVRGSLAGGDDVRESQTLRRSRLLSVSRVGHLAASPVPTLSETGGVRRSMEDFQSEEDFVSKYAQLKDDSPAMASVTNSVDMRAQFRSATSTRAESKSMDSPLRGLGSTASTTRSTNSAAAGNKKDDAKLVNTTSTTDSLLYSPSQSISSNRPNKRYPTSSSGAVDVDSELDDEDEDEDREYTTVSRVQQRGKSGGSQVRASGEFGEGARIDKTMLSSINTLNSAGEHSDGEHYDVMDEVDSEVGDFADLSQTVDSEGDMLVKNHPVRSSAVRRKADEYEREAAAGSGAGGGGGRGSVPRTPPHRDYNRDSPESKSRYDKSTFSNASKGSNVSLFNNLQSGDMVDDFEDSVHSLAFSHNEDD